MSPLALAVLPELLKLQGNKSDAVVSASKEAAVSLVESVPTSAVLSLVLAVATSDEEAARSRCCCCDLLAALVASGMLGTGTGGKAPKKLGNVLQALLAMLTHSSAELRAASGRCFWTVHERWPKQAEALRSKLDASQQRGVDSQRD